MGGLVKSLFGGATAKSQETSESGNKNLDKLNTGLSPMLNNGGQASNAMAALLGIGGDPTAQQGAFQNFRDSTGYQFQKQQGMDAITGNAFAHGYGNSGATLKALDKFGTGLADSSFNSYLQNILGLGNQSVQASGVLSDVGKYSTGQSTTSKSESTGGLGKALGQGLSLIALSDRKTKQDIRELFTLDNGLTVYEFKYIGADGKHIGVIADEVADILPEALGPVINGFQTVDYGKVWR